MVTVVVTVVVPMVGKGLPHRLRILKIAVQNPRVLLGEVLSLPVMQPLVKTDRNRARLITVAVIQTVILPRQRRQEVKLVVVHLK